MERKKRPENTLIYRGNEHVYAKQQDNGCSNPVSNCS